MKGLSIHLYNKSSERSEVAFSVEFHFHFIIFIHRNPISYKVKEEKVKINLHIILVFLGIVFRERMLILQEFL